MRYILDFILDTVTMFTVIGVLFDIGVIIYRSFPGRIPCNVVMFLDYMDKLVAHKSNSVLAIDIVILMYVTISLCILR